jgi:hypothetical protein
MLGAVAAGPISSIAASPAVLLAEVPKAFDDYTPPARTEELPPESGQGGTQGGGTTKAGGGTTTTGSGGGKLTVQQILGTWCSTTSNYIIGRNRLTVILTDTGSRSNYRVTGFDFTTTTAIVRWVTSENRNVHTTFGRFSADRRQMVQLAANRIYRRCALPGATALSYQHILGSWCDVDSKYIITRTLLTVVFSGGRRLTYKVTGFKFEKDVVEMYWIDGSSKRSRTRFGHYAGDRRSMTQLGANRVYRRC